MQGARGLQKMGKRGMEFGYGIYEDAL